MSGTIQNQLLAQTEQHLESQLPPQTRANYDKIVLAGMHAGLEGGPKSLLASLQNSKDPIADAAKGSIALVMFLRHEAHGIMPVNAMVPAAMTLMLHALGFVDKSGMAKIGQAELARATHIFTNLMLTSFHVTPNMINHAANVVHGFTQNPVAMDAINRKIGVVRHPMASIPTIPGMPVPHPEGI
jgi:hypothetical protein